MYHRYLVILFSACFFSSSAMEQSSNHFTVQTEKELCSVCNNEQVNLCCSLCKKVHYCSKKCQLDHQPTHVQDHHNAMDHYDFISFQSDLVKNIDQIPQLFSYLILNLEAELPFKGKSLSTEAFKVLPLSNWNDCRICSILSCFTDNWDIYDFHSSTSHYKKNGEIIPQGIMLLVDSDKQLHSLEILKSACQTIIDNLKTGWVATKLENHPNIMDTRPEKEWFLFTKKRFINQEGTLMRFLASKFGLSNNVVYCNDRWLKEHRRAYAH